MIDYFKSNWKTVLVGVVVGALILWGICGCDTSTDEPAIIEEPVVEETPVEVTPEVIPEPVVE